jgi:hypothetical protein
MFPKMPKEFVMYLFGSEPLRLNPHEHHMLQSGNPLTIETDFNSDDIKNITQAIFERLEIDINPETQDPFSIRINSFERMYKHSLDFWHCKFEIVKVKRLKDLTRLEKDVIEERVKHIKQINNLTESTQFIRSVVPLMLKETEYDYQFGPVGSIDLINEHFYEIIACYDLKEDEATDLATYVSERDCQHVLRAEDDVNMFNESDEMDKQSVNDALKKSRLRFRTNGREFLK